MPIFTFLFWCLGRLAGPSKLVRNKLISAPSNHLGNSDVSENSQLLPAILRLFDASSEQIKSAAAFAAGESWFTQII
jgi:hypothetical protein